MAKKHAVAPLGMGLRDAALARRDSLSLDQLARHANAAAREAENNALYHACRAGAYLAEARARLTKAKREDKNEEGWRAWVAEEWHHSRQHAERCIALAEACEFDPEQVAKLEARSIRGALAHLGRPQDAGAKSETRERKPAGNNNAGGPRVGHSDGATDVEFTVTPPAPAPPQNIESRPPGGDVGVVAPAAAHVPTGRPADAPGGVVIDDDGRPPAPGMFVPPGPQLPAVVPPGHAAVLADRALCRACGCVNVLVEGMTCDLCLAEAPEAPAEPDEDLDAQLDEDEAELAGADAALEDEYRDPDPCDVAREALTVSPVDVDAIETLVYESGSTFQPLRKGGLGEPGGVTHEQHALALLTRVAGQLAFKLEAKQFVSRECFRLAQVAHRRVSDAIVVAVEAVTRAEETRRAKQPAGATS